MPEEDRENEAFYAGPTKMPIYVEEETPFISVSEFKASLRQMLTVIFGGLLWYLAAKATVALPLLPFTMTFALIIWGWLPIGAILLAFGRRKGMPMEKYLADRISHALSARVYVPMDDSAELGSIHERRWEGRDE